MPHHSDEIAEMSMLEPTLRFYRMHLSDTLAMMDAHLRPYRLLAVQGIANAAAAVFASVLEPVCVPVPTATLRAAAAAAAAGVFEQGRAQGSGSCLRPAASGRQAGGTQH